MKIYPILKRVTDIVLACICLLLLSPFLLLVSITVKLSSKGPVIFRQKRIGKYKKEFYIYKFRTMRIETPKDIPTHLLSNPEIFISKYGRFLRKTSLDELPQLFNILRGEMSFIGPRPALWNQFDLISEREKYGANDIYPGLTGWAQINGRDELSISVKAKLDGEYVKKSSFYFDLKIIFFTIFKVLKTEGVKEGSLIEKNQNKKGVNL
ncbi:sugar transferase [Caldibacillus lycopersici]|uniref:Sugar transferase n=1 Tax=Perspicuibacillus lycopersici TaxID=1325689 RepID=A0AAE3IRH2_9BACI|nr:sugar transferase [Perspicuibacillus lycopersici]